MAPFDLARIAGSLGYVAIFMLLGMGFGAVLEMSGFGDSRRLAAQFYFRDMTVLKVMFTGIIVAAVLVHLASALQLLDLSRVWVNPTYLMPGIIGGLIMGVGFIVGGFCPGTSLVAAATLKLDGVMFVLGGFFGAWLFGETVQNFDGWWHSTYYGRFTVYDWLNVPAGIVVLVLVLVALGAFLLAEVGEVRLAAGRTGAGRSGEGSTSLSYGVPSLMSWRGVAFAASVVALASIVTIQGQPSVTDRWRWIEQKSAPSLTSRSIYVDPAEVVDLRRDLTLAVRILEVRSEADYNRFHLAGSERISLDETGRPDLVRRLTSLPDNTIVLLAGNGEPDATEAWKRLAAQGVLNLYVLEGGINHWLDVYPPNPAVARRRVPVSAGSAGDVLAYDFAAAIGDRSPSAHPELSRREPLPPASALGVAAAAAPEVAWFDGSNGAPRDYVKKVKLQRKVAAKGGCG